MKQTLLACLLVGALAGQAAAQSTPEDYRPNEPPLNVLAPRITVPPLMTGREAGWLFTEALRLHRDGYIERAIPIYRAALAKDPGRLEYRPYLALALDQSGRPDLALQQYDQYLKLEPNDSVVRLNRVVALLHQGDLDTASLELESMKLSMVADPTYQNLVGLLALKRGEYAKAQSAFETTLVADGSRADPHVNLALVLMAERKDVEARQQLDLALQSKQPPKALIHTDIGVMLADSNHMDEALKLFQGAWTANTPDASLQGSVPQALLNLATGLARQGKDQQAILVAAKLVDALPERPDARVLYARLLAKGGRFAEARKQIDAALTQGPQANGTDWTYALEVSGIINLGLGDSEAARTDLEQVVLAHPESVSARHNLALALDRNGNLDDAIEQELAAAQIDPANKAVWYHLGVLYDLDDRPKPAVDAYEKFLKLAPKDPAADGLEEHVNDLRDMAGTARPARKPVSVPAKTTKPVPTSL